LVTSAPPSDVAVALTVFAVPALALSNAALPAVTATPSPASTPPRVQDVTVAAVVPSYGLSAAVAPVTVKGAGLIVPTRPSPENP
jgi:hypothetical protein